MRRLAPILALLVICAPVASAQTREPAITLVATPQDLAAVPKDAVRSLSGLAWIVITPGTGTGHPTASSTVTVNYTGWTADGKQFDSSDSHGGPATFPVNGVIPGWTEAVQLMVKGEKRRFWIPGRLAYDDAPDKNAPKGMLTFDIELISFTTPGTPPPVPADVAAPPADAERTASGLVTKVLKPGTGTVHPQASSEVTVHYTLWTSDGKMLDSSFVRGEPATLPVAGVIAGFSEGVQLMVVGESRRLWIPGNLAYDASSAPGAPKGPLVFDVELLEIK